MPLRRWWDDRVAGFALRWEVDIAFRRSAALLVTAITLVLVGMCLLIAVVVAYQVAPQWFGRAAGGANPGAAHGGEATFPVPPLRPLPTVANAAPIAVATSPLGPLMQPTPTPIVATGPLATATDTPIAVNPPSCPALTDQPTLGGRSVQVGTLPAPLAGGCPAQIVIHAPSHPGAPVVVALTFGNLDPIGCTVTFVGVTDSAGNATLPFGVPGSRCFHGTIFTNGTITVGGDTSANASFTAQA